MQWTSKATEFGEIRKITAITPFKVTDFGTNRKPTYHIFLLVNRPNINLPPILHHFQDNGQIFASNGGSLHFNVLAEVIPCK